jgi:diacylglycerol kinase
MTNRSFQNRTWWAKFRDALIGLKLGVRGQSSFFVHVFAAAAVIVVATVLGCTLVEWCLLLLCIAGVLTAEMLNSALESMAKAITEEHNPHLAVALDVGSAAVLLASTAAAIVGTLIFVHRLGLLLGWW